MNSQAVPRPADRSSSPSLIDRSLAALAAGRADPLAPISAFADCHMNLVGDAVHGKTFAGHCFWRSGIHGALRVDPEGGVRFTIKSNLRAVVAARLNIAKPIGAIIRVSPRPFRLAVAWQVLTPRMPLI